MQASEVEPLSQPTVLFEAGRQAIKVRFIMLLSLACAAGALYWGVDILQTYGVAPADGGVLAPVWQRAALGLFVGGLGVAFAFGMWVYGRHYVVNIQLIPGGTPRVRLRTMTFFGSEGHELDAADVRIGERHAGQLSVPDLSNPGLDTFRVDAPWGAIHVRGRSWPLIIDLQGDLQEQPEPRHVRQPRPGKRRRR